MNWYVRYVLLQVVGRLLVGFAVSVSATGECIYISEIAPAVSCSFVCIRVYCKRLDVKIHGQIHKLPTSGQFVMPMVTFKSRQLLLDNMNLSCIPD